jgi:hypothetical protein
VARVLLGLAEKGISTQGAIVEEDRERGELNVSLTVRTVSGFRRQAVADWLVKQPGIERLDWGQRSVRSDLRPCNGGGGMLYLAPAPHPSATPGAMPTDLTFSCEQRVGPHPLFLVTGDRSD